MRPIIRSIIKNPFKNTIYVLLLLTAFIPTIIIINTYLTGTKINDEINTFRQSYANDYEAVIANEKLFEFQSIMQTTISTLMFPAALLVFLSTILLPFVQYLLSLGRGYEIGVLRALGMGKVYAWVRLLIENILLLISAFVLSCGAAIVIHKHFAFLLLSIDNDTETILYTQFGDIFDLNHRAVLITLCAAAVMTLISSMLCNILISKSAPLKLLRDYK